MVTAVSDRGKSRRHRDGAQRERRGRLRLKSRADTAYQRFGFLHRASSREVDALLRVFAIWRGLLHSSKVVKGYPSIDWKSLTATDNKALFRLRNSYAWVGCRVFLVATLVSAIPVACP